MTRQAHLTAIAPTDRQRRILALLAEGHTASHTAKLVGVSRSYVSKVARGFEHDGIIRQRKGNRYNRTFTVNQTVLDTQPAQVTPFRVHNIAMKFTIRRQSAQPTEDPRSGYNKKWKMRGGYWRAYWFPGQAGEPNYTITVMPRTIMVRMDKMQTVIAPTARDAQENAYQLCHTVRQQFIDRQRLFGVVFDIDRTGARKGNPHFALDFHESHPAAQGDVSLPHWWKDRSQSEAKPGHVELETDSLSNATPAERTIQMLAGFGNAHDAFTEMLNPISRKLDVIQAHALGGTTAEQKVIQLTGIVALLLEKIDRLEQKMEGRK